MTGDSEIHSKNIVMAMLEEVPEDACKTFEEHLRVVEEHMKATGQISSKSSLNASRRIDKTSLCKSRKLLYLLSTTQPR
jgi:hypothetical protein